MIAAAPARALVRLPNWLGDTLMARPFLHALRAAWPGCTLWVVGPRSLLGLLGDRTSDRAVAWPPDASATQALSTERFGVGIVLPPSFSSAWWLRSLRADRRVGFSADGRDLLLTDPIARPSRGDLHLSEEYLGLGGAWGIRPVALPRLVADGADRERAAARTAGAGFEPGGYAVLAPGAVFGPAKRWAPERFVALGRLLLASGIGVAVCGAASDREVAAAVADGIGRGARDWTGATALGEQLALCAGARVTVSNDSGLAHLAAASGAPTLTLFGSTSSAWTAPLGERARVVQHAPVCSPCFQRRCRIGTRCLAAISVDEVAHACLEMAA